MKKIVLVIALCVSLPGVLVAQQRAGSLKGQVLDELGGAIVGASVTAIDGKGVEKTVVTNEGRLLHDQRTRSRQIHCSRNQCGFCNV